MLTITSPDSPPSFENDADADEDMDDAADGNGDNEPTIAEPDNEDDNADADADGEPDDDADDAQDNGDESPTLSRSMRPPPPKTANTAHTSEVNGRVHDDRDPDPRTPQYVDPASPVAYRPTMPKEALTAVVYDIAPTIAAPHSTSINTIAATPDMRWVFSGGSDGWVRKFNWVDTANSKTLLTVAQRHPFVDSVTKAGVLMSYWENEDTLDKSEDELSLSPVYSLVVQHQALWLLSGTESGGINLQTVRHQEGKRITSLYGHTSAVSVMHLSNDETSLLSGSWDKTVQEWDLNTGQIKSSFTGSSGQISAIEMRPISNVPIPRQVITQPEPTLINGTFGSNNASAPMSNRGSISFGRRESKVSSANNVGSPGDSLFGGGGDDDSLFGDANAPGAGDMGFSADDDEFSRAIAEGMPEQSMDADGDLDMALPNLPDLPPLDDPIVPDTNLPPPPMPTETETEPRSANPTSHDLLPLSLIHI